MNTTGPEAILKIAQSFMESRILLSAAELNLFTFLKQEPLTAAEVARKTGCDVRPMTFVLDALVALGFLVKRGQRYQCDGSVGSLLAEDSPDSVLPMVRHVASLWKRWSHLTDIARAVNDAKDDFEFTRNPDEMRAFIGAMHVVAAPLAKRIVADVNAGSSRALLDVGGGSGSYTIAFLRAAPKMNATLFDMPDVVEMARERLNQEGLLNRVALIAGDYLRDEFPRGHDLALISAIIHSNSPEQNLEIYRKVYRALDSGGRILIRDHVMEPDRAHPRDGAIFAINMLVGTDGGGTYTYEEIESGLKKAGFIKVRLLRQGEHMDAVVEAFKP
jgi:SAM-dependent methyltransferase